MEHLLTNEQAQAIIDAWDEGRVFLSTGRQDEIANTIVSDLQAQLDADLRVLTLDDEGDYDVMLTVLQLMGAI